MVARLGQLLVLVLTGLLVLGGPVHSASAPAVLQPQATAPAPSPSPSSSAPPSASSTPTPSPTPRPTTSPRPRPAVKPLPGIRRYEADVRRAMRGSEAALRQRVRSAAPGERLALNLDIDNTSLMTQYRQGAPMRRVLRLVRLADRLGVDILFNTGRSGDFGARATPALRRAGFPVDGMCLRRGGEALVAGKQRCRAEFVAQGYTIVFNIGNRPTDLQGGDYERGWKLPDYQLQLQ